MIADRTNRTRGHRERWLRTAQEAGCAAFAVVMATPYDIFRVRSAGRDATRRLSDERMGRMLAAMEPVDGDDAGFADIDHEGDGCQIVADVLSSSAG